MGAVSVNLSKAFLEKGMIHEAMSMVKDALALRSRLSGPASVEVAWCRVHRARILQEQRRFVRRRACALACVPH